jgi:aldose sugar dehydrogenase
MSMSVIAAVAIGTACFAAPSAGGLPDQGSAVTAVNVEVVASGRSLPWDLAFLPDETMLFTERGGRLWRKPASGQPAQVQADLADVFAGSESGLMGIAIDPGFAGNRRFYMCQAYRGSGSDPVDIRVVRWQLSADGSAATRVGEPVVSGLPISSGRHGGCRLEFHPDGTLRVGTGDAAIGTNPQDLGSLGGKTLRVNADGSIPADNPFAGQGGNARYVWTFGHRNVQGLAVRPGTGELWSAEHGPDRDDEVNLIRKGANYGWHPVPGYNESVPMTDTAEFPDAVEAVWSSGSPTVATSGAGFIAGSQWGEWDGALAVAELKGSGVRVLTLSDSGQVVTDEQIAELDGTHGRIRSVEPGPGGALYLTTSNGSNDEILRVTPS